MFAKLTILFFFRFLCAFSAEAQYPELSPGMTLQVHVSGAKSAHFVVDVQEGQSVRISADQRQDIKLQWQEDGASTHVIDSFEFGTETATLRKSGTYIIEVRLSKEEGDSLIPISRQNISAADAEVWEQAELAGTQAKESHLQADILASLDLWKKIGDQSAVARTQLEYGDNRLHNSDPIGARDAYEEALAICSQGSMDRCLAEAANNSGQEYMQLGDFRHAQARLQLALDLWKKQANPVFTGKALSNLGLLFRRTGDLQQAISYFDQARPLLRTSDVVAYAIVLNNLGLCYTSLNEYGHAISYLNSALAIYKVHPSPKHSVRARLNLGRNWMLSGNMNKAALELNRALSETGKDEAARADVLNNLGQLAWRRKLYAEGEARLTEALQLEVHLHDRRGQGSAFHYLGLIAEATGDRIKAADFLDRAAKIRSETGLRDDTAESLYSLAHLQHERGNDESARKLVEEALALLESVRQQVPTPDLRAAFYSSKHRLFDLLLEITMAQAGDKAAEEGLLVAERGRGRALLDLLAEGSILRQLPKDFVKGRTERQHRINLLLMQLSFASQEQQADIRRQLELLLAQDAESETAVRQTLTNQQLGVPLTSIEALRRVLPPDTTLLEYHLGERQGYLWIVNARGVRVHLLRDTATIAPVISRTLELFENILERKRSPAAQKTFAQGLDQLSRILLGKLKPGSLSQRLVIVPDGVLYRVPFAALRLPGRKEPLGLTYDLLQAPSAGYLVAGRSPRSIKEFPKAIVALADPVFSIKDPRVQASSVPNPASVTTPDLARLAFGAEFKAISALPESRRTILRSFKAGWSTLREFPVRDFGLVYFASHAVIDDRLPELSRIVLSLVGQDGKPVDGLLRPYHLARLHLDGSIVVLSGCETALGKQVLGEGLLGFSSSLFAAGASQLVLALDKIDAEASSEFFSDTFDFYLARPNPSMERSLRLARQKMAASTNWSDVYYWASFVVIGRPSPAPGTHALSAAVDELHKQ